MARLFRFALILWISLCALCLAAETQKPVRLAVLDLTSPTRVPWLGSAVAETVGVKLAQVEGLALLERDRIQEILLSTEGETKPERLGVQHLLTGSVQVIGPWPDPGTRIRISARILSATTGTLQGKNTIVLDGTVSELFAMESDLAERFARSVGKEPTALHMAYREERALTPKQSFGEGLLELTRARAFLKEAKKDNAAAFFSRAAASFRNAQEQNEGRFFARAHHYEATAREGLAKAQQEAGKRAEVRAETVKQFRQDAARAAPAFFDLGRALEASELYEEALDAHAQYLRWIDGTQKMLVFQVPCPERRYKSAGSFQEMEFRSPEWYQFHEDDLFVKTAHKPASQLQRIDARSGKLHWKTEVPCDGFAVGKTVLAVYDGKETIRILARNTGALSRQLTLPGDFKAKLKWTTHTCVFLDDAESVVVILCDTAPYTGIALSLADGKERWRYTDASRYALPDEMETLLWGRQDDSLLLLHKGKRRVKLKNGTFGRRARPWWSLYRLALSDGRCTPLAEKVEQWMLPSLGRLFHDPKGRLLVGLKTRINDVNNNAVGYHVWTPETKESEVVSDLPERRFAYDRKNPKQIWHVRKEAQSSLWAERVMEWRSWPEKQLLWSYTLPGKVWSFATRHGLLYLHTEERLLCLRPPAESSGISQQQAAWIARGRCLARLGRPKEAGAAFARAADINIANPEVHWAWAEHLPEEKHYTKARVRHYDTFLLTMAPGDKRKKAALQAMGRLAGLRYILDGYPIWDGSTFPTKGPHLVRTFGRRYSDVPAEHVEGRDATTGALLWRHSLGSLESPGNGTTRLSSRYLHLGDRYSFLLLKGHKWDAEGAPCWIAGDINTGKVLKSAPVPQGYKTEQRCDKGTVGWGRMSWFQRTRQGFLTIADGQLLFSEARKQTVAWRAPVQAQEEVYWWASDSDQIYVALRQKRNKTKWLRLLAFDAVTGAVRWERGEWPHSIETKRQYNPAALALCPEKGTILCGINNHLTRIDCRDGKILEHKAHDEKGAFEPWSRCPTSPHGTMRNRLYRMRGRGDLILRDREGKILLTTEEGHYASKHFATSRLYRVGAPLTLGGKALDVRIPLDYRQNEGEAAFITAWQVEPEAIAGRYRLHNKPYRSRWTHYAYHDPRHDMIMILDRATQSTYAFDHRKLLEFLLLPGE